MSDNILEPTINGLPPVTDWQKVFLALQQANEAFLRGATLPELGKQIIGDVQIQGADFVDLPVAEDSTPVALPIPETGNKFGFLADGKFTQPTGGTLEYSATQWGLTLFDGDKWVKKFTLELPMQQGVNTVRKDGEGLPKESAVYRNIPPIFIDNYNEVINEQNVTKGFVNNGIADYNLPLESDNRAVYNISCQAEEDGKLKRVTVTCANVGNVRLAIIEHNWDNEDNERFTLIKDLGFFDLGTIGENTIELDEEISAGQRIAFTEGTATLRRMTQAQSQDGELIIRARGKVNPGQNPLVTRTVGAISYKVEFDYTIYSETRKTLDDNYLRKDETLPIELGVVAKDNQGLVTGDAVFKGLPNAFISNFDEVDVVRYTKGFIHNGTYDYILPADSDNRAVYNISCQAEDDGKLKRVTVTCAIVGNVRLAIIEHNWDNQDNERFTLIKELGLFNLGTIGENTIELDEEISADQRVAFIGGTATLRRMTQAQSEANHLIVRARGRVNPGQSPLVATTAGAISYKVEFENIIYSDLRKKLDEEYKKDGETDTDKEDIEIIYPPKIYCVANNLVAEDDYTHARSYSSTYYLHHSYFIDPNNLKINFAKIKETGNDKYKFFAPYSNTMVLNNNVDVLRQKKTINIVGEFKDKKIEIEQVSVKASVGQTKKVDFMQIGDSNSSLSNMNFSTIRPITDPSIKSYNYLAMLNKMDEVDSGNSSLHKIQLLGTICRSTIGFSYKGNDYTVRSLAEGRGGWLATSYAFWANNKNIDNLANRQGVWDLLGLGDGTGNDFVDTPAQNVLLRSTPEGKYTPINTPAFLAYMQNYHEGVTNYNSALVVLNNLWNNPINPFFDINSTTDVRFSLAKYIERYLTLDVNGNRLPIEDCGTAITPENYELFDVKIPTVINIQLGTNDPISDAYGIAMRGMVDNIKSFDDSINVMVSCIDGMGTYFPEFYPNYDIFIPQGYPHDRAYNHNKTLLGFENVNNKIFYLPAYFVQSPLTDWVKNVPDAQYLVGENKEFDNMVTFFSGSPYSHPGKLTQSAVGYQLYSLIKYILS